MEVLRLKPRETDRRFFQMMPRLALDLADGNTGKWEIRPSIWEKHEDIGQAHLNSTLQGNRHKRSRPFWGPDEASSGQPGE